MQSANARLQDDLYSQQQQLLQGPAKTFSPDEIKTQLQLVLDRVQNGDVRYIVVISILYDIWLFQTSDNCESDDEIAHIVNTVTKGLRKELDKKSRQLKDASARLNEAFLKHPFPILPVLLYRRNVVCKA